MRNFILLGAAALALALGVAQPAAARQEGPGHPEAYSDTFAPHAGLVNYR